MQPLINDNLSISTNGLFVLEKQIAFIGQILEKNKDFIAEAQDSGLIYSEDLVALTSIYEAYQDDLQNLLEAAHSLPRFAKASDLH